MNEIESQDVAPEADVEEVEAPDTEEVATEEAPAEKPKETDEARLARITREKARLEKKLGKTEPKIDKPNTGELTEEQLDYLDLKGITDDDDISVIQRVMKNTGQSLRETLKDEYVAAKLKANADARAVALATPGATKRGGQAGTNLEAAIAKAERDPTALNDMDYETRSKVVSALAARQSATRPSWQR